MTPQLLEQVKAHIDNSMMMAGGNTEAEKAFYRLGAIAGAEYLAGILPKGGVWVKASERLPEHDKDVIVRSLKTSKVKVTSNMGHNTGWDISMDWDFKWDNTEWLDESPLPPPASQPVDVRKRAKEYAEPFENDNNTAGDLERAYLAGASSTPSREAELEKEVEMLREALEKVNQIVSFYDSPEDIEIDKIREISGQALRK